MKVLIVEDDDIKCAELIDIISKVSSDIIIEIAKSVNSAKNLLSKVSYDLMLLDIRLPQNDSEVALEDGGVRLYEDIINLDHYFPPYHIVAITAYDEAHHSFNESFKDGLFFTLIYRADGSWKELLRNRVGYLYKCENRHELSPHRPYDYDLAIVCALKKVELDPILGWDLEWKSVKFPNDSTYYFTANLTSKSKTLKIVATSCPEMGMSASSTTSMKVINHFRPKYICMPGICAGLLDKTKIGDVLVADVSFDYGSGKFRRDENGKQVFDVDPLQLRLSNDLKSSFEMMNSDKKFFSSLLEKYRSENDIPEPISKFFENAPQGRIGPVSSGAAVVADKIKMTEISDLFSRKLIGVEMEIYGMYYAATHSPSPRAIPFGLKAVCDFGDENKSDHFQKYAAQNAALYLYEFVKRYL